MRRPVAQRAVSARAARIWTRRLLLAAVAACVAFLLARWADLGPEPIPAMLIVLGLVVLTLSLLELTRAAAAGWDLETSEPVRPPGADARHDVWVRTIEGHLTARQPGEELRSRLSVLASDRLRRHHGLTPADPHAAALLGPELDRVLNGPVRRLSPAEIDDCVERIARL